MNDHRGLRLLRALVRGAHRMTGKQIHAERLRRFCARRCDHDLLIDDFDGCLRFWCRLDEHIGSHIFWRGAYSGSQLVFLKEILTPEMVFFDVGANQGEFTVFAAGRLTRGRVVAVEPVAALVRRLERNVEANGFDNVEVLVHGLGERAGRRSIYTLPGTFTDGTDHSGLPTLHPGDKRGRELGTIELKTLDEVAAQMKLDRLDAMKIDVEGAELSVLRGGATTIRRFRPQILMEVDESNCRRAGHSGEELLRAVEAMGYAIGGLDRRGAVVPLHDGNRAEYRNVVCRPAG